jgi:chitin disaccharide deacetylase
MPLALFKVIILFYICHIQKTKISLMKIHTLSLLLLLSTSIALAQNANGEKTYAEKLGFPSGAKVLILHIDDVGMSYDSNDGAIQALEEGVATSCSMMMPCGWIPGFFHYLKAHPDTDAGLHLTLTSEWKDYRWGPLAGKSFTPGLVDEEGALWPTVAGTAQHATAQEVDIEIKAQLDRALTMNWVPTHLDSHMGTLFAKKDFLEKYLQLGIENNIPVMFPGGHNTMISQTIASPDLTLEITTAIGQQLWMSGLPVLDDLHNVSYGWTPEKSNLSDKKLQEFKTQKYIETIDLLKPGLTMVIMHCTWPSDIFSNISDSGPTRKGDLLAMKDPKFKEYLKKNNIILTTWREVKKKRDEVKE